MELAEYGMRRTKSIPELSIIVGETRYEWGVRFEPFARDMKFAIVKRERASSLILVVVVVVIVGFSFGFRRRALRLSSYLFYSSWEEPVMTGEICRVIVDSRYVIFVYPLYFTGDWASHLGVGSWSVGVSRLFCF